MELWYSEFHTENVKLSVRVDRQLFSGESEYQRIDVFESAEFGKFVALDGEIVFSEKDEFIYDEMVTHVPMAVHPNVKNVLIIGGGDGGVAKELIQYPGIESIDVVETDKMFVGSFTKPITQLRMESPMLKRFTIATILFLSVERVQTGLYIQ